MRPLYIIAVLQLYINVNGALAQNASLRGYVFDGSDYMAVEYANVYLDSIFISSYSQAKGAYQLSGIIPGQYTLCVSHIGYQIYRQRITVERGSNILNIELKPLIDTLSPVVVTGTGTHYHLDDVPVQTEIITQKEIQEISGRSIEEVIAGISSSVDFINSSMGTNIKINGLGKDYVLILVNGRRLTGGIGGYSDLSRINPEDIEQIEIVKGASSTLYGSDAIAGVINIITKKPQCKLSAVNNIRLGEYGDLRQFNALSYNKGKFKSKTSLSYKKTNGWQLNNMEYNSKWESNHELPYLIRTYDMPVNKNRAYTLNQYLDYNLTEQLNIFTELIWFEKTLYFPFKGRNYNYYYNNAKALAGCKYKLKEKDYIEFSFDYSNFKYYTEYPHKYNESYITPEGAIKETYYPGDRFKNSEQVTFISQARLFLQVDTKNSLSAGAEVFGDYLEAKYRLSKDNVNAFTYSLYVQDEYKLNQKFDLVGGVRFICHDKFGIIVTPKLSAMYKVGRLNCRVNYANGFKSPTLKELYYYYESERMGVYRLYLGNERLEPQISHYYSLSADYKRKGVKTTLTLYIDRIYDMIDYKIIPTSQEHELRGIEETKMRYNIEDARNIGADLHWGILLFKQLAMSCGYSYADAKNISQDIRLNGVSAHSANCMLTWKKVWGQYRLNMSLSGIYKSDKFYLDEDFERSYADPYQLWKLTTTHQFNYMKCCELKVIAGIDNIFNYVDDRPYGSHYGTLNPGCTFFAGLNIKYVKHNQTINKD